MGWDILSEFNLLNIPMIWYSSYLIGRTIVQFNLFLGVSDGDTS